MTSTPYLFFIFRKTRCTTDPIASYTCFSSSSARFLRYSQSKREVHTFTTWLYQITNFLLQTRPPVLYAVPCSSRTHCAGAAKTELEEVNESIQCLFYRTYSSRGAMLLWAIQTSSNPKYQELNTREVCVCCAESYFSILNKLGTVRKYILPMILLAVVTLTMMQL
jgi:hypothetical protein